MQNTNLKNVNAELSQMNVSVEKRNSDNTNKIVLLFFLIMGALAILSNFFFVNIPD